MHVPAGVLKVADHLDRTYPPVKALFETKSLFVLHGEATSKVDFLIQRALVNAPIVSQQPLYSNILSSYH